MSATVAPSSGNLSVGAEASWWKQFFTQFWALACHKTGKTLLSVREAIDWRNSNGILLSVHWEGI